MDRAVAKADMVAIKACVDLVGRSGGRKFEVGYLHDDVPIEEAAWYATAQYQGVKIISENMTSPAYACDELAHKILDGGTCQHCHRRTTTAQTNLGYFVHARDGDCVWHREGDKWLRGCE